jgi:hypothetical protein
MWVAAGLCYYRLELRKDLGRESKTLTNSRLTMSAKLASKNFPALPAQFDKARLREDKSINLIDCDEI